jgi:hypothetical protein
MSDAALSDGVLYQYNILCFGRRLADAGEVENGVENILIYGGNGPSGGRTGCPLITQYGSSAYQQLFRILLFFSSHSAEEGLGMAVEVVLIAAAAAAGGVPQMWLLQTAQKWMI